MSETRKDVQGPVIMWLNCGYDGWRPHSFDTVRDALESNCRNGEAFVLTRPITYEVKENG